MTNPPPDALPIQKTKRDTTGLEATHIERHTYLVTGGQSHHFVYHDGTQAQCDCADFIWRDRVCRHIQRISEDTDV